MSCHTSYDHSSTVQCAYVIAGTHPELPRSIWHGCTGRACMCTAVHSNPLTNEAPGSEQGLLCF